MKLSRFQKLPVHFIDTSVVLGAFSEEEEFYEDCKSYLNRVGYKFRGVFPTSVVGEIFMIVLERKDFLNRRLFFDFFDRTIFRRKIDFAPTSFEAVETIKDIQTTDYNADPLDAEHLALAISRNANAFVTLDNDLINNEILKSKFGISIKHPKQI